MGFDQEAAESRVVPAKRDTIIINALVKDRECHFKLLELADSFNFASRAIEFCCTSCIREQDGVYRTSCVVSINVLSKLYAMSRFFL